MMVNIPCLKAMMMKIIYSIALFETYCICLTNVHRSNHYEVVKENKQLIYVKLMSDMETRKSALRGTHTPGCPPSPWALGQSHREMAYPKEYLLLTYK